jgi:hypothetical protein
MSRRVASLSALVLLVLWAGAVLVPAAHAADLVLAQETGEDSDGNVSGEETEGGEETSGTQEDEGASEEAAETGAGGESEGATEETGPPWTYQMARMSAVILLLVGLITVIQYYRMVVQRSRGRV